MIACTYFAPKRTLSFLGLFQLMSYKFIVSTFYWVTCYYSQVHKCEFCVSAVMLGFQHTVPLPSPGHVAYAANSTLLESLSFFDFLKCIISSLEVRTWPKLMPILLQASNCLGHSGGKISVSKTECHSKKQSAPWASAFIISQLYFTEPNSKRFNWIWPSGRKRDEVPCKQKVCP